jgi:hypothetical protein
MTDKDRKTFESYAVQESYDISRESPTGYYANDETAWAWIVWQDAIASRRTVSLERCKQVVIEYDESAHPDIKTHQGEWAEYLAKAVLDAAIAQGALITYVE